MFEQVGCPSSKRMTCIRDHLPCWLIVQLPPLVGGILSTCLPTEQNWFSLLSFFLSILLSGKEQGRKLKIPKSPKQSRFRTKAFVRTNLLGSKTASTHIHDIRSTVWKTQPGVAFLWADKGDGWSVWLKRSTLFFVFLFSLKLATKVFLFRLRNKGVYFFLWNWDFGAKSYCAFASLRALHCYSLFFSYAIFSSQT